MTRERYEQMPFTREVLLTLWDGREVFGKRQGYWINCGTSFLSRTDFAGWREIPRGLFYEAH